MTGAELIAAERKRQIESENWTAQNDDQYVGNELVDAAESYLHAATAILYSNENGRALMMWPWKPSFFKPKSDRVGCLVKAGALLAAEIDRIQREGTHE